MKLEDENGPTRLNLVLRLITLSLFFPGWSYVGYLFANLSTVVGAGPFTRKTSVLICGIVILIIIWGISMAIDTIKTLTKRP